MNFDYEVIIPVRNGGQALENSIKSILSCANAGKIFLTISDNFSTDGSPWKKLLATFPQEQWRLISPPAALGRVEHWSWAFGQGQRPWVKMLMAGDRVENGFWDWASAAITQFPQAGLLVSGVFMIDPARAHPENGSASPRSEWDATAYNDRDFLHDSVRCLNTIGSLSQVMVRADVVGAALPFDAKFPWTADWRFYSRCLSRAPAVRTRARLVCLDRSIVRLSTSWKGLRGSFGEEWKFASEQARISEESSIKALFWRSKVVGTKAGLVLGRMFLPPSIRACLTTASGLHRKALPKNP